MTHRLGIPGEEGEHPFVDQHGVVEEPAADGLALLPVSFQELSAALQGQELVNYFQLVEAVETLRRSGHILPQEHQGEPITSWLVVTLPGRTPWVKALCSIGGPSFLSGQKIHSSFIISL